MATPRCMRRRERISPARLHAALLATGLAGVFTLRAPRCALGAGARDKVGNNEMKSSIVAKTSAWRAKLAEEETSRKKWNGMSSAWAGDWAFKSFFALVAQNIGNIRSRGRSTNKRYVP